MLHLKDKSVVVEGLVSEIYFALGIADRAYADEGLECVITSARDAHHNPSSLHGQGRAVDLKNTNANDSQRGNILTKLKRLERYGFDVVDEKSGQTSATTGSHFHIEYQPKVGERGSIFVDIVEG